jgi:hypothetical protein
VHGLRQTRGALELWRAERWRVLRGWFALSFAIALLLLLAVWAIAGISNIGGLGIQTSGPPFHVGDVADALAIFGKNLLVLALHAMACVAGFIAGASLPVQAARHRGFTRVLHERRGRGAPAHLPGDPAARAWGARAA